MPLKSIFGFLNFVLFRENNDFAEFMAHLIHRKRVPLLHNTVLILCDEGDGLVAVFEEYYHTVKQFGFRIGQMLCQAQRQCVPSVKTKHQP